MYRPDWNENKGPRGHAARKYERMAVTVQSGEGEHAIKSRWPSRKTSVLEDLRIIGICRGLAREGWNNTQSADRSDWGRNLDTPWYVNSLQRRKQKNASVKAAQIIEKSRSPNQESKMGRMVNKTLGVTGCLRTRVIQHYSINIILL